MPSPTGSVRRPWPSVVITSFGSTRNPICLVPRSIVPAPVILTSGPTRLRSVVCAWPLSILNDADNCERSVAFSALLPARQGARRQRADHLRDIEPLDRAVLEYDERSTGHVRHDRALAGAGGAHADLRLHPAVDPVEIGEALQQRKRAHAGKVGPHRV